VIIRKATAIDKEHITKFCKNTFSWGDYIQDVWDFWFKEGNLFVLENTLPIGVCHAYYLDNNVWIEGIRIHPSHRKQGLASQLVLHIESLAQKRGIETSSMLIDVENNSSLQMAQNLGYVISEKWNFYSLVPKQFNTCSVRFGLPDTLTIPYYVKSWRWLRLNNAKLLDLLNNNQVICCDKSDDPSLVIISNSEHFEKTMLITLYSGSNDNDHDLLSYIQNLCFRNNYYRIQILTKNTLAPSTAEYRLSFNLMSKLLS